MNKKIISIACISGAFFVGPLVMADDAKSNDAPAAQGQPAPDTADAKPADAKKQIKCKGCGKPEKDCDCKKEGHHHGKGHHKDGEAEKK